MKYLFRKEPKDFPYLVIWIVAVIFMAIPVLGYKVSIPGGISLRILLLCAIVFIGCTIRLANRSVFSSRQRLAQWIVAFFLGWLSIMYLRSGEYVIWYTHYTMQYNFPSFYPMLLLLVPVIPLMRTFFRTQAWLCYLGIVLLLLSSLWSRDYGMLQFIFEGFVLGAGLIVMTQRYHSKNLNMAAYICLVLGFLFATVYARRNLMITSALYLGVAFYELLFSDFIKSKATRMLLIISAVMVILGGVVFFIINSNGVFSKISERAASNTREYVVFHFVADFSTAPTDLIWGRGMEGTYACGGIAGQELEDDQRNVIECGYLQNILKGGIIYLLLYLFLFIYAMTQGFRSHNRLLQACAWILLIQMIEMIGFGLHTLNVKGLLLWMAVALCLQQDLKEKTDEEVKEMIYEPKFEFPKWVQ